MTSSLLQGRRFYCREWAFSKVAHSLENRATAKTCGALVMGGPGCGKTALCCELVWPTAAHGKQLTLTKKLLAFYFCQAHDIETLSITNFILCMVEQISKSKAIEGYEDLLSEPDVRAALEPGQCERDPDTAFQKGVLLPLMAVTPPPHNMFILVDSIDESYLQSISEKAAGSKTIAELLSNNHQLFPQWLLLMCSARKQSKSVTRLFTGFRKIGLDDLRKSHVVRDVQQYILCRLDQEEQLRQHLSRQTAEMLNQLHIKSNGCFLYLEKVLDGVAESFILLREIREIPGTLNGLYLWLCQRLFVRKQFGKVQPILNVILAARRPLTEMELYSCAYTRNTALGFEEFKRRLDMLTKLLIEGKDGTKIVFDHSFAEWLLDVKHCTQKYLCQAPDGHGMLAMSFTMHASSLTPLEVQDFALHLAKSNLLDPPSVQKMALWLIESGANVEDSLSPGLPKDPAVLKLLVQAGAKLPTPDQSAGALAAAVAASTCAQGRGPEHGEEGPGGGDASMDSQSSLEATDASGRTLLCTAAYKGNLKQLKELVARGANLEAADKAGQTALNLASRQGHAALVAALLKARAAVDHEDQDGWTALRSAAWGGHTEVVGLLLAAGAQVDQSDSDQRTALRAAAWGGHDDIVLLLLEQGANVNQVDNEGRTALIAAAYMGHREIVEHLLQHGADINHEDIDGRTALSVAALCIPASRGHAEVVALLLEQEAQTDHQDKDGMTPLLVAAYEGHRDVCELLLEFDADVDHSDLTGRTPLSAAASMGHANVVNLLLFWGSAVDAIDSDGRTVLSTASQQGNVDVVRQLLERGLDEMHRDNAGWTPLHIAAFEGHKEVVELLLESGARLTEQDNDGRLALMLAAQEGHLPVVATLVDSGSPIDSRAHDGKTSLRVAALEGHKDVVEYLLGHSADANYKDADGRSTLYVLALENHVAMTAFLLENSGHVEGCDLEGRTPLHVAAWQGHYDMAELLLGHGADVNALDNDCRTPLQSAAWQGHADLVKLLLQRGARVDHTCNQGATALCIAAQEGHTEVVRGLLYKGANPNHADQYGRTATRVAVKGGHGHVVRLLEEHGAQSPRDAAAATAATNNNGIAAASGSGSVTAGERSDINVNMNANLKPGPSSALASAMAIANGYPPPNDSPSSSYDRRKSNKSSSNMNTSSTNQSWCSSAGAGGGAGMGLGQGTVSSTDSASSLSFMQQLQQCSMSKHRTRPLSRVLSPVSEPHSPIYSPPCDSPLSDVQGGALGTRLTPDLLSPRSRSLTSPRRDNGGGGGGDHPVRIISNPSSSEGTITSNIYESIEEPIWQRQADMGAGAGSGAGAAASGGAAAAAGGVGVGTGGRGTGRGSLNAARLEMARKGAIPDGPSPMKGIAMGEASLVMKSPETRKKRNGIVTNPNLSVTKNVNGYFNQLAEAVDNLSPIGELPPRGAPGGGQALAGAGVGSGAGAASPSASLPTKRAARPNGLPLKKETPL